MNKFIKFSILAVLIISAIDLYAANSFAQDTSKHPDPSKMFLGKNYPKGTFVPKEIIVTYKNGESPSDLKTQVAARTAGAGSIFGRAANSAEDLNLKMQGKETPEQMLNDITSAKTQSGTTTTAQIAQSNSTLVKSNNNANQLQSAYSSLPEVQAVQHNFILSATSTKPSPNDPDYQYMWDMQKIKASDAWGITTGSNQIIVAVLDSGIDSTHEDLGTHIMQGVDFVTCESHDSLGNCTDNPPKNCPDAGSGYCDTNTSDNFGHGTHVAGIIGAIANNNKGIAGLDWNVKIMPVRVLGNDGSGTSDHIIAGIRYAADHGAKVINMSLGGDIGESCPNGDSQTQDAINYALGKGVIVIAANGNNNQNMSTFTPASCNGVISVGATTPDDKRTYYSDYGSQTTISAPGGDFETNSLCWGMFDFSNCNQDAILSTWPPNLNPCPNLNDCAGIADSTNDYALLQGTSMASPHVAGVVALMLSENPNLTPDQVKNMLQTSADSITTDQPIGNRLNAYKAVLAAETAQTTTPSTTIAASPDPSQGGSGDSQVSLYFIDSNGNLVNSLQVNPGDKSSLDLYMSTGTTNVDGYDITISAPNDLTITNATEDDGAQKFDTPIAGNASVDREHNSLRLAKITTNTQNASAIQGALKLATITFQAGNAANSTAENITFSGPNSNNPAIVSPSNTGSFETLSSTSVPYTIASSGDTFLKFSLPLADMSDTIYRQTKSVTVCVFDQSFASDTISNQEFPDCKDALIKQTHDINYARDSIKNGPAVFKTSSPYFDIGQFEKDGKTPIVNGTYTIAIKPEGYLAYITQAVIAPRTVNVIIDPAKLPNPLTAGDINGDDAINILDYNILSGCGFANVNPQPITNPTQCQAADLNNDGVVDGIDFNIWDRGLNASTQSTNSAGNSTNSNTTPTPTPTQTITPTATPTETSGQ